MNYYVVIQGAQAGPFSEEEVRQRLERGEIPWMGLAWREGMVEWRPLAELMQLPAHVPPPMPAETVRGPDGKIYVRPGVAGKAVPVAPTSGLAVAALVCGAAGLLTFVSCIPAIILGHMALAQIRKTRPEPEGKGMAIAGLVLGYLMLVATALIITVMVTILPPLFEEVYKNARMTTQKSIIKNLEAAIHNYQVEYNHLPLLRETSAAADLPPFLTDENTYFVRVLEGREMDGENPRRVRFLELRTAKPGVAGADRTQSGMGTRLVDGWGMPLTVVLDSNGDGMVNNPDAVNTDPAIAGKAPATLRRKVAIFSNGPDKKPHTADDICNWR